MTMNIFNPFTSFRGDPGKQHVYNNFATSIQLQLCCMQSCANQVVERHQTMLLSVLGATVVKKIHQQHQRKSMISLCKLTVHSQNLKFVQLTYCLNILCCSVAIARYIH